MGKLRSALAYDLHLLNCPLTVKSSLAVYSPSEKYWWMLCFDLECYCAVGNVFHHCRDSQCMAGVISGKGLGYCNGSDSEKSKQLLNIVHESVSLLQGEYMNRKTFQIKFGSLFCLSVRLCEESCWVHWIFDINTQLIHDIVTLGQQKLSRP